MKSIAFFLNLKGSLWPSSDDYCW